MLLLSLIKVGIVIVAALSAVPVLVYLERRGAAFIQERLGPNRVDFPVIGRLGGLLPGGLAQPLVDAVKLFFKEDLTPARADKWLFRIAPLFALLAPLMVFLVVPYGQSYTVDRWLAVAIGWLYSLVGLADPKLAGQHVPLQVLDLNIGILYVIAVAPLAAYGLVLGGWASNSKYSLLGALRAAAQMISYEVGLGLVIVAVVLMTGSVKMSEIVSMQTAPGFLFLPAWNVFSLAGAPAFILFMVCAFAENNRLPFDMPECEPELVGGYHTEYSSMKFALFFMGEYVAMVAMSALAVTLFLGGWHLPGLTDRWPETLLGAAVSAGVFAAKVGALCCFYIWVRWTFPRFRYDQLMGLGWKVVVPLAMLVLLLAAVVS